MKPIIIHSHSGQAMENFGKSKNAVWVAVTLLEINVMLHFVCILSISLGLSKILVWGSYLDVENVINNPVDPSYYFDNRLPIVFYLLFVGIALVFSNTLALLTHIRPGDKSVALALSNWLSNIFSMVFNFAVGVFLMVWAKFNSRLLDNTQVTFDQMRKG